jgi:hypothetical protein
VGVNIVVVNGGNTSDGNVDTKVDKGVNVVDVNAAKIIDEREKREERRKEKGNTQKEREKVRKTEK